MLAKGSRGAEHPPPGNGDGLASLALSGSVQVGADVLLEGVPGASQRGVNVHLSSVFTPSRLLEVHDEDVQLIAAQHVTPCAWVVITCSLNGVNL